MPKKNFAWKYSIDGKQYDLVLQIPVLFIIGDTEGQDKICGRYTSRSNVQKLCRYCNIPFSETDDPDFKFKYNQHEKIMKCVATGDEQLLKKLSLHRINNAWKDVLFCDQKRGLFGAVCGDIMHCLQQGLFAYLITMLFDQKKFRSSVSDSQQQELQNIFSRRSAFTDAYCKEFDKLSRWYGKTMMHQSDRSMPRTHFYSSYVSVARKNANEMSGILLVYLMVLNSYEGLNKIDQQLGEGRTAQFIHLIELMLMLEKFCKEEEHKQRDIYLFKRFMPYLLNTYKDTLNRQVGCQMKIIKFHLPTHFADDILRFGSMLNFDTGIGESHHKTEAKKPAKNTQRRQASFEFQTATRQIDNLVIKRAETELGIDTESGFVPDDRIPDSPNKWFRYTYDTTLKVSYFDRSSGSKKVKKCKWKDHLFQTQLEELCKHVIDNNHFKGDMHFFAQHNRGQFIFRADPNYNHNTPWYDWALVYWDEGIIPCKLLLFWEIKPEQFLKPFRFGTTFVHQSGIYAIGYSVASANKSIKAHGASDLVSYACIDPQSDICIFPLEAIYAPITSVPFHPYEDIVDAKEWIFLKPTCDWKDSFVTLMQEAVSDGSGKRKRAEN